MTPSILRLQFSLQTITIFFYGILFLSNCGQYKNKDEKIKIGERSKTIKDTLKYVVVLFDTSVNSQFEHYIPTNLSQQDFIDIENILRESIDNWNTEKEKEFNKYKSDHPKDKRDKNTMTIDISKYKLQYTPVLNDNKEKEVWIRCACDGNFGLVIDGGKCYFQLKVNLTKKKHTSILINSMA